MKKAKSSSDAAEMRPGYKRSDFAVLERGKFHKEATASASVILLDPALAKLFPTSKSVNETLRGLLELSNLTARLTTAPRVRTARRAAAAG